MAKSSFAVVVNMVYCILYTKQRLLIVSDLGITENGVEFDTDRVPNISSYTSRSRLHIYELCTR